MIFEQKPTKTIQTVICNSNHDVEEEKMVISAKIHHPFAFTITNITKTTLLKRKSYQEQHSG